MGDVDGAPSRHGECERGGAEWEEKRENEAKVRERKGRGEVALEMGPRYSAASWDGIERPGGDDVALDDKEAVIGAQPSGGLENPSDSSDSEDDEKSGTSVGMEWPYRPAIRGLGCSSSSSPTSCTRTARGWRCLPEASI